MSEFDDDIPAGSETRTLSSVDHGKKVDLKKLPTRLERFGYSDVPQVARYYRTANRWAKSVMCPVCGSPMTMLRGRKGRYGENITYQCHAQTSPGKYCLCVITLTVGNNYWMRPGDFETCDFDWQDIANQTVQIRDGDHVEDTSVEGPFRLPEKAPPCPWVREVLNKAIWDVFWEDILTDGKVYADTLIRKVQEKRPQNTTGKPLFKLNQEVSTLTQWMTDRTGLVVRERNNVFTVIGKTKGKSDLAPWNDQEYRREFGLEGV